MCIPKAKLDAERLKRISAYRMFVLIAWLLTLLTFVIWLRALHSIPIYTHTPPQCDSQKLQLQNLMYVTKLLLLLSLLRLLFNKVLTASMDGTAKLWSVESGECIELSHVKP